MDEEIEAPGGRTWKRKTNSDVGGPDMGSAADGPPGPGESTWTAREEFELVGEDDSSGLTTVTYASWTQARGAEMDAAADFLRHMDETTDRFEFSPQMEWALSAVETVGPEYVSEVTADDTPTAEFRFDEASRSSPTAAPESVGVLGTVRGGREDDAERSVTARLPDFDNLLPSTDIETERRTDECGLGDRDWGPEVLAKLAASADDLGFSAETTVAVDEERRRVEYLPEATDEAVELQVYAGLDGDVPDGTDVALLPFESASDGKRERLDETRGDRAESGAEDVDEDPICLYHDALTGPRKQVVKNVGEAFEDATVRRRGRDRADRWALGERDRDGATTDDAGRGQ